MLILEIRKAETKGELCWSVFLIDDEGNVILQSTELMAKGVAVSAAKSVKHEGYDAPFIKDATAHPSKPVWRIVEKDGRLLIELSLDNQIRFNSPGSQKDGLKDIDFIEDIINHIKSDLHCAEIRWNPPELNPAHDEKESDRTPTKGHPGS
ncbi:MAG: hypothetical protein OXH03_07175 [Bacteroidetes bacterium]|nr:hypothetical protein [Bacteroidota bacterium]